MHNAPVLKPVAIKGGSDDGELILSLVLDGTVKHVLYILLPKDGLPRDCAMTVVENNDGGVVSLLSSLQYMEELLKFNRRKSNSNGPTLRLMMVPVVVAAVVVVVGNMEEEEDGYGGVTITSVVSIG